MRTDLHMNLFLGALRLKRRTAGTFDQGVKHLRMNLFFHLHGLQIYFTDFCQIFNLFLRHRGGAISDRALNTPSPSLILNPRY